MTVVLVGTLDTKAEELGFARAVLREAGVDVHVIDVGVMGEPGFEPETPAGAVAAAAGSDLETLRDGGDRGGAMAIMGEGAAVIARELYDADELDGIMGLGGSGNTSVATTAMRALPYGVPKLMVSTMASGDVRPYVGPHDVLMMHAVADVEGVNQLTRRIITNAAYAMAGMVDAPVSVDDAGQTTIGVTMFGVTTPCVQTARSMLEDAGDEVIVFHATGTGGQALEGLVEQGIIDAVLDVTTTELADELVGGVLSAGPDRLTAAGEAGVPQIISVGALDMVNFGPPDTVPERFADRTFHEHNPQVTLMRTTPRECAELGSMLAKKVNAATGPVAVALPLGGVSMLSVESEPFHDPSADAALFDAIRDGLDPGVECIEYDGPINDDGFAELLVEALTARLS